MKNAKKRIDFARVYEFLKDLARNNNREWFNGHKERYQGVKEEIDEATRQLIELVAHYDARATLLTVANCTYRIYRDTRFSQDKTPYKNHIGIFVNPPLGKKSLTAGYYLHIEPGQTAIYGGSYYMPPDLLRELRNEIYANVDEYRAIVEAPEFKKLFPTVGYDPLKTAPKGFPKDWPYIDYLKPRMFGVSAPLADDFLERHGIEGLDPYIKQIHRLNTFYNYTLDKTTD